MNDPKTIAPRGGPAWAPLIPFGIVAVVLAIYWPVMRAGFVWDDVVDFLNMPWLRQGNHWQHFLFRDFNDWSSYFRPLIVGLFTLEVRAFRLAPGPMHAVSLAIHLANTLLVGWLAAAIARHRRPLDSSWKIPALAVLLFGLHPILIEPVTWIGCQFELVATFFMLLGACSNLRMKRSAIRAAAVASCFLLALLSKESAIGFPMLIALLDLLDTRTYPGDAAEALRGILKRNWATYVAIAVAGSCYLMLRYWALGALVPVMAPPAGAYSRLHEISFLYLNYWRMLLVPMPGMSPVHSWPAGEFGQIGLSSVATIALALAITLLAVGLCARRSVLGGILVAVTISLLPVLHLVPASFDASPYHERYAMTALAFACALLPVALAAIQWPASLAGRFRFAVTVVLLTWAASSVVSIRTTVPFWHSNISLWRWALSVDPDSLQAKDGLISAYVDAGNYAGAWQVFDRLGHDKPACPNCVLNMAVAAISENRLQLASELLDSIRESRQLATDRMMFRTYLNTRAKLLTLQGEYAPAESLFRLAMSQGVLDPAPQIGLATVLLLQGKYEEAREQDERALALLPAEEQPAHRKSFSELLAKTQSVAPGPATGPLHRD